MIDARSFCDAATRAGFSIYTGVPCSYVKPLINYVIDAPDLAYIGATNEGDAVAIAAGAALAGRRAVVMMQNSGLGNAVSPLTSLNAIFGIPILLVVTLRGEPGGHPDEPQHELMGRITTRMLETMEIGWDWFPTEASQIGPAIANAVSHMERSRLPFCLVMRKDSVAPHQVAVAAARSDRPSRAEALRAIQRAAAPTDVVVATTGYTGRELHACGDRPNQIYVVGSMGCASSFGLGVARARADRRVLVVDGDGAMLMRLGALATLAYERPPNLVHILLDNEAHESTGGQSTVSHAMDLAGVAEACGYEAVARIASAEELETLLNDRTPGLRFISLKTRQGVQADLPRPTVTPRAVAARMAKALEGTA